MGLRAEGTAQGVKHLLYKHKDMSSDPRTHIKLSSIRLESQCFSDKMVAGTGDSPETHRPSWWAS